MRMWNIDPSKMCRQHLLGEHLEMHMFVGSINKGISMAGYVKNGLLDTSNLLRRHFLLVEEMERRGMNHQSDLPNIKLKEHVGMDCIDVEANIKDLYNRCELCRKLLQQ